VTAAGPLRGPQGMKEAASPPLSSSFAAQGTGPLLRPQGCFCIALRATACGRPGPRRPRRPLEAGRAGRPGPAPPGARRGTQAPYPRTPVKNELVFDKINKRKITKSAKRKSPHFQGIARPRSPHSSASPPAPSRSGTTPDSSPHTRTTTKASASTHPPAPTPQPAHKDASSPSDAAPLRSHPTRPAKCQTPPLPSDQDDTRTPRIDPKRCSMQPEVSSGASGRSTAQSGSRHRQGPRRTRRCSLSRGRGS